jgi:hypothetical protein
MIPHLSKDFLELPRPTISLNEDDDALREEFRMQTSHQLSDRH